MSPRAHEPEIPIEYSTNLNLIFRGYITGNLFNHCSQASHTSHIFTIIVCILGLALNLFIMGTAIKCLRLDANRPGFASIANLAAVDILASLWFLLAIILPDSAGWTDQTLFFEALSMAEDRGFSEVYIKSQG
jgi:hypothetical protein